METLRTHILVVDDEEEIRDLYKDSLEESGHVCHGAANGNAALELRDTEVVDLMLLDITMPGMNGLTLFQHVKELHPGVGVIFVTAMDDVSIAVDYLKVGACDYLVKPVSLKHLKRAVEDALDNRQTVPDMVVDAKSLLRETDSRAENSQSAPEEVSQPGHANGNIESPHEPFDEGVYEGAVRLNVVAPDGIPQMAHFVSQLRLAAQLRVLHLMSKSQNQVEILVGLRGPLRLKEVLAKIQGVSQVSVPPHHQFSSAGLKPVFKIGLAGSSQPH